MSYFAIDGVKLDGTTLPEIAHEGATFSIQDIDSSNSGRNAYGSMIRDRVAVKVKWQLSFPPMSQAKLSALLKAVSSESFQFTYPDPTSSSGVITKNCYVGDRTAPLYSLIDGVMLWKNVSFGIVEL
ncbi:MAG: DUF6711 family protein [Acutalibacteraceae bacterium]